MESSDEEGVLRLFFKERAEKSTGGEVVLLEWSPTMDILALALADHSIILNRLSWHKVWSISPIKHLPTAMAWRPDGRVLAVGSQDGCVGLYNVENGQLINEFVAGAAITSLSWAKMEESATVNGEATTEGYVSQTQGWSELLPPLPAVDKRVADTYPNDPKLLQPTETLRSFHLLFAGDVNGSVHICALGAFLIATIKTSPHKPSRGPVMVTRMSPSFSELSLLSVSKQSTPSVSEPSVVLEVFKTDMWAARSCELHNLVLEFGHVVSHLEYLNSILTAMFEAWDDLLFKLDNQLDSYAKTLQEGRTVADEFLVLLACGHASQELKDFLMFKLTAKGVKKLGLSLEHSYSNIKKFLLHHFQVGVQGLLLHLGELLYMTAGDGTVGNGAGQFGCLGLSPSSVQACVNLAGTVGLKSQEMILAIDHSLRSAKVFFMWLYVTILKLSNEQIPKNLKDDLTPEELKLIVDFLKKRLTKAKSGKHAFNMETVGQYLSNDDLKYTEEKPAGFWEKFVVQYHDAMHSSLNSSVSSVFKPCHDKSLLQLCKQLRSLVEETFTKPTGSIEASLVSSLHVELKARFQHVSSERLDPLVCHFSHNKVLGFCIPSYTIEVSSKSRQSGCTLMDLVLYSTPESESQTEKKTISFYMCNVEELTEKDEEKRCSIVSVRQYDDNNLTILSRYSFEVPEEDIKSTSKKMVTINHSVLAQLPLSAVLSLSDSEEAHDVGPILTQVHVLDPFNAGRLAVMGGTRKLAAVVSHNGKKVRLFDTEEEDEDEQNITLNRSIG